MRLTDFWERMHAAFGPGTELMARYHVFSQLGGRTVEEALAAGEAAKDVWRAVCEGMELPVSKR